MLQIDNLDDKKTDWNINESHLIGGDLIVEENIQGKEAVRSLKNSLNDASLEESEQICLSNGMENSLVLELERNLFDPHSKRYDDLLVIQNADIKLLSCGNEFKYSFGFALPYVGSEKSEVTWDNATVKESIKSDWPSAQKVMFEEKDGLQYDSDAQETSKTWNDLEKGEHMLDEGLESSKIESDLLLSVDGENKSEGRSSVEKSNFPVHFLSNRFGSQLNSVSSMIQNPKETGDDIHINFSKIIQLNLPNSENLTKYKPEELKIFPDFKNNGEIKKSFKDLKRTNPKTLLNQQLDCHLDINYDSGESQYDYFASAKEEKEEKMKSFLPEKSLPLKKKAKMKRSVMSDSSNFRLPIKNLDFKEKDSFSKGQITCSTKNSHINRMYNQCYKIDKSSRKTEGSISKEDMRSGINTLVKNMQGKSTKSLKLDLIKGFSNDLLRPKNSSLNIKKEKFNSIFQVVDDLKNRKLINSSVWQTLYSGLKEMDSSLILKEMNLKQKEKIVKSYSVQLKAFALVLYFKQPVAFNYLSKIYKNGWPSLSILKDWKFKINNRQKERTSEGNKCAIKTTFCSKNKNIQDK